MVVAAAGIVLIPGAPLGLITTSVQALAGVLLPSATVFLLLLCNDREVLGPWSNAPWLNAIASVIIGVLVELSLILMASTMFPSVNVTHLFLYLSLVLLAALAAMAVYARAQPAGRRRSRWRRSPGSGAARGRCRRWRCSSAPCGRPGARRAMLLLRGYLVVAVLLLIVKTVQLGH